MQIRLSCAVAVVSWAVSWGGGCYALTPNSRVETPKKGWIPPLRNKATVPPKQEDDLVDQLKRQWKLDEMVVLQQAAKSTARSDLYGKSEIGHALLTTSEGTPSGVSPAAQSGTIEIPVNLLSFDGGGVKGLFSLRALVLALQGLMGDKDTKERWVLDARNFVNMTTDKATYKTRWLIWAQQMDSLGISPQDPNRRRWLDYSYDEALPMQLVEIDLFFEYYVSCVLALSGTSTGGIITGAIAVGMTLTQLVALYMDPNSCRTIFPFSWNPLRWNGIIQAKYTQDGVKKIIDNILSHMAPCDDKGKTTLSKFLDFAAAHDKRIDSLLRGLPFDKEYENRILHSLKSALKAKKEDPAMAPQMLKEYQERLWRASKQYLEIPRSYRYRSSSGFGLNWLNIANLQFDDTTEIFPTRFVITARCANNAGAVFFDSQEPCPKGTLMYARNRTLLPHESLVVNNVELKDVLLSTSAAPYFFPAHKVGKLSFQDGGVVANDPGLVSSSFSFRTFETKRWGFTDQDYSTVLRRQFVPAFKLLRIGAGESKTLIDAFPWWKAQGIGLIAELAPMFMDSDSDRTNLLSDELSATKTLKSLKLNTVIPRQKQNPTAFKTVETLALKVGGMQEDDIEADDLPMDKLETVYAINNLFSLINPDLYTSITIPTEDLLKSEANTRDPYAMLLVDSLNDARDFLKSNLHNDIDNDTANLLV